MDHFIIRWDIQCHFKWERTLMYQGIIASQLLQRMCWSFCPWAVYSLRGNVWDKLAPEPQFLKFSLTTIVELRPPSRQHVNSTGPQVKSHSSEVTLDYDCSFVWRGLHLGHQVHGLLQCAGKPRDGLLLLSLSWIQLLLLPWDKGHGKGHQEQGNS